MRINHRPNFAVEVAIAVSIVLLPFLIFLHLYFSSIEKSIEIFGLQFDHGMPANDLYVWMVFLKLTPIILLSIWFITTEFKWRYFIIIPILVFFDSLIRYTIINFEPFSFRTISISALANLCLIVLLSSLNTFFLRKFYRRKEKVTLLNLIKNNSANYYRELIYLINKNKTTSTLIIDDDYKNRLFYTRNLIYDRMESKLSFDSEINNYQRNIIIGLLIFTPILHNLHRLIPANLRELNLGLLEIGTFGFSDVNTAIWLLTIQLTYLLPLALWFITCVHWWRYAILVPIILTLYQIWELIFYRENLFEISNLRMIPYILIVLSLLSYASIKIKYEIKISQLYNNLNREIEEILILIAENPVITKTKTDLEAIRQGSEKQESDKLEELIRLREQIIAELQNKDEQ